MRSQTLCRQLSEFLKMHREREAGQKVCLKCFFTTTANKYFIYYFFPLSQKGRNEKRDSFYTAKRVSSVDSCPDETRLAVFSVPFSQNKFRTCFFQAGTMKERLRGSGRILFHQISHTKLAYPTRHRPRRASRRSIGSHRYRTSFSSRKSHKS
jgi:hypothetical protein